MVFFLWIHILFFRLRIVVFVKTDKSALKNVVKTDKTITKNVVKTDKTIV